MNRKLLSLFLGTTSCIALSVPVHAFTQKGAGTEISNGIPMGHEWVTRLSALELLGGDPIMPPDPNDPRKNWTKGKAKNLDLSSPGARAEVARIMGVDYHDKIFQSTYKVVYDTIVGERWVDLAGYNVTTSMLGNINCFDAVAQEPVEIQYDHFMRRYDERGGEGGATAAANSRERFVQYFVAAAMAPQTTMKVWDGGGYSELVTVDRNYFLFGRAAHLFEDSFSPEHTVRMSDDNFESVRQVKSYMCAAGSEQHTHSNEKIFNYTSGDVIWKPGTGLDPSWSAYKPSNMKTVALVATEASKDLWAAFIRSMGTPIAQREQWARQEAKHLVDNWLAFDKDKLSHWYDIEAHRDDTYVLTDGQTGKGQTVAACMQKLGVASGKQEDKVRQLEADQKTCLYNVVAEEGYADLFDPAFHMPFNWRWKTGRFGDWVTPPPGWKIPTRPADTGARVNILSATNNLPIVAADGVSHNQWVYVKSGLPALGLIKVPDENNTDKKNSIFYRVIDDPDLFLSYNATTGAVKLWASPNQANYVTEPTSGNVAIKSLYWDQYMWLSKESPYITRTGNPKNLDAQWKEVSVK